ncbi:unnamed protein product [Ascophyllum nodosum]
MLAQLLGMGRAKRDKDREPVKEAKEARQDVEAAALAANGSPSLGEHEGISGRFPHVIAPPKTLQHPAAAASATLPAQPNGNGFGSHPSSSHRCLGLGSASTDDPNADTASADPVPTDSGSARLRAPGMVPSGPGASGFSSSGSASSCSSSSSMAMPQKALEAELSAVQRGLHLQIGQPSAKTEAQLGDQQLEAAKRLRHLLSTNMSKTIQELLSRGWVPLLLRWLGLVHRPNLQVETLAALTTVAQNTSEHTPLLLKHGAVGTLVSLLKSPSLEMVEQAMWVLGKMAQDSQDGTTARDTVLQAGALGPIVRRLEQHPTMLNLQRIGAWAILNLLDGQPRPAVEVATVSTVMPGINRLLRSSDTDVLSHACSALSHLCDGSAAHIKIVVDSGVCRRLVELLDHPSSQVVKPALRTIGNVVCAEDEADYTEAILEAGSVVCLKRLIAHPNREIQKEACWTLSNIAAGSVSQIQSVLDSGAMPQLIKLATSSDTESEVRSEAFWVVLNAASCGSDAQIEYLVSQGCVEILSDLLGESSMVMMALEGIERVLSVGDLQVVRNAIASHSNAEKVGSAAGGDGEGEVGEGNGSVAGGQGDKRDAVDGEGGGGAHMNPFACMLNPEKIQALETHKNSAVAKRANRLWTRYFVTCAICRRSFSRHGSTASFCTECKCYVCGSCDCTVFHLAYQDKLWEEMEGRERQGKQAQQAAKKSKKAKKKEKRKNAAKEAAVEPLKDDANAKARGHASRRGPGGKNRSEGDASAATHWARDGNKSGVTRSDEVVLEPKKRRSPSPKKPSFGISAASTESNSEDYFNHSSLQTPQDAYASTPARALITATAMAVTAAAAKAATTTNVSNGSSGEKGARRARVQAVPVEANGGGSFKASKAEERRRGGKKAESLEQQLPQQRLGSNVPKSVVPGSSRSGTISGRRGKGGDKTVDDDSEGQWVVVGSRGGPQVAASGAAVGSKVPAKGAPAPAAAAGGGGGGGGVSVVGWASESSPASAARVASAAATAAAGRVRAAAASAQSLSPLLSVPPSTLLPVVPTSALAPVALSSGSGRSSGGGNAWGVGAKGVPLAAAVNPPGLALTPALASNGTRPTAVSRSGSQRRRPGPGPGSVWGASVPTPAPVPAPAPDRRSKHQLGSFLAPPRTTTPTGNGQSSRPIGPSNRAGVIGPPQHAQKLTTGLPVTGNGSSKGNGNDNRSSTGVPGGGGSDGVVSGIIPGGSRVVPAATGVSVGGSSTRGPDKAGDGEALVENEKLVSFLMETGSILALAQRLEEEDEWRKPGASSASSGRG